MNNLDRKLWSAMCDADIEALDELLVQHPGISIGEAAYDINDAIDGCPIETIGWFIEQGAPVRIKADDGFPLLHKCIDRIQSDRYEVMKLLLDAGADVNEPGMNDWTPLHRAAAGRDDAIMVKILLDAGADVTIKTEIDDYNTAEMEARQLGKRRTPDIIRDYRPGISTHTPS